MDQKITINNQPQITALKKQKNIISIACLLLGVGIFTLAYCLKNNVMWFGLNNQIILDFFIKARTEKLTSIFTLITNLLSPTNIVIVVGLATIFWILLKKEIVRPVLFGGAIFVSSALSYLLKGFFKNPRPPQISMISPLELDYSFPSGHTLIVVVLTLVLGYLVVSRTHKVSGLVSWLIVSGISIAVMAISRLYLGYHWMSDIFASIGLGLTIVGMTIIVDVIIERIMSKKLQ